MKKIKNSFLLLFLCLSSQAFGFGAANPDVKTNFQISPYIPSVKGASSLTGSMYLGASCERSHDSFRCMLCNCMREAANEPYEGKKMVGLVVKTRVSDPRWPNDICSVIYQYKQFSWTTFRSDRRPLPRTPTASFNECVQATEATINAPGNGIEHYHADYVHPRWARKCHRMQKIGRHIFYTCGHSKTGRAVKGGRVRGTR